MFDRIDISDCTLVLTIGVFALAGFEVIPWWSVLVMGGLLFLTDVMHTAAETNAVEALNSVYETYWERATREDQLQFLREFMNESDGRDKLRAIYIYEHLSGRRP